MTETMDKLRDKDKIVLQAVQEENDDIQKITETTTLENHEVNYCFTKLEDLNLIHVEKPDGYTTRNINGQKRVFQTPKQANLTNRAEKYLEDSDREDLDEYENLGRKELVQKVHRLERQVDKLEDTIQSFRKQVQKHLLD
jgi:predicted transcriptional regulator